MQNVVNGLGQRIRNILGCKGFQLFARGVSSGHGYASNSGGLGSFGIVFCVAHVDHLAGRDAKFFETPAQGFGMRLVILDRIRSHDELEEVIHAQIVQDNL